MKYIEDLKYIPLYSQNPTQNGTIFTKQTIFSEILRNAEYMLLGVCRTRNLVSGPGLVFRLCQTIGFQLASLACEDNNCEIEANSEKLLSLRRLHWAKQDSQGTIRTFRVGQCTGCNSAYTTVDWVAYNVRNNFVKNRRPSKSFLPSAVVNFQKLLLSNSVVIMRLPINFVFHPLLMHVVNFQQKSGISNCFLTVWLETSTASVQIPHAWAIMFFSRAFIGFTHSSYDL